MGENSEAFPASKATTSETNLSTSSRPRPSSSGGNNQIDGVYARKRRDLNVTPHAFVLFSNASTTSSPMESTAAPLHDSTVTSSTELSLASDVNNATVTNIVSNYTTLSKDIETSSNLPERGTLSETPTTKNAFDSTIMKVENLDRTTGPDHFTETTSKDALTVDLENVEKDTSAHNSSLIVITENVDIFAENASIMQNFSDNTANDNDKKIEAILSAKIDYEKAFEPDYDDEDDPPETPTEDLIKIEKEIVQELREKPQKASLPESISLKPSDIESPEAIQHDYPIYAYGQDEVEIVNLNHKTISTTAKSKAVYDHHEVPSEPELKNFVSSEELTDYNLAAEEFDTADVINIKSDLPVLQTHDINTTNADGVVSETNKSSKISIIEVPKVLDSLIPSKRILVNVTIATEPESPNSPQSVYVLSVSLPTENANSPEVSVNSQSEKRYHNSTSHESTKNTDIHNDIHIPEEPKNYGGECECSCPCLDPETSSPSTNPDVTIQNATDFMSSTTETTIMEPYDSTTTEEMLTTTICPEITTSVPPTPMILVLEGRMLVRT